MEKTIWAINVLNLKYLQIEIKFQDFSKIY